MPIGQWELILVLLLVVILFGAKKIPELARSVGKAKLEYKKGVEEAEEAETKEAKSEVKAEAKSEKPATEAKPEQPKPEQKPKEE